MTDAADEFWTTHSLAEDGVTLILFQESGQVMAEVIGPYGHDDAVMVMPAAIQIAMARVPSRDDLLVLDDEELWQRHWGHLRGDKPRFA
ncbi:hypothetical protein [Roseomonas elaeocarpi]|uniref:Uncharacterized protein n=1 Tax=Roseomonas elaeocarpi TaxID=907779 RepID=A0ABV6JN55_9PROT